MIAALELVTSLSRDNLMNRTSGSCFVPRVRINQLRDALEAIVPGVVERCYEIQAQSKGGTE